MTVQKQDFLSLLTTSREDIDALLELAALYKRERRRHPQPLKGRTLGMIFEKSSTRTRVSFEVAMLELGGTAISLDNQGTQLGRGETHADTARVLSRYVDFICIRTFEHERLEEIARYASVPVINALTDLNHPCQLLADLLTVQEWGSGRGHPYKGETWASLHVAYVGDANNMTHSWIEAALALGFRLSIATPEGSGIDPRYIEKIKPVSTITVGSDAAQAVRGAHVITTDTWFSMGQVVSEEKRRALLPFQVNATLMGRADPQAIFLHCLPAHRGEEVTEDVFEGPQSRVFDEAENRLHVQKAVLMSLARP